MSVGSSLRAGVRLLVDRPGSVLPVYLLVLGLTATARVPLLLGLAAVLVLLTVDGRLDAFITELTAELRAFDDESPEPLFDQLLAEFEEFVADAGGEPTLAGFLEALPDGLETAILDLVSPGVIGLVVAGLALSVLVAIVANGLGNAAAINGIYGALSDDNGVRSAVTGVGRDWKAFIGIALLQVLVVVLAVVPLVLGVSLFLVSPIAGGLATGFGLLLGGVVVIVGLLLLAFAGQSVVVDNVGFVGAVRRSAAFPVRRPLAFVGYVFVALAVFALISILSSIFGLLGVSQLSGLIGPLVLLPFLDIFKLVLYADRPFAAVPAATGTGSVSQPSNTEPAHRRFVAAFRDGISALGGFVRGHPAPIALATGVFALASLGGFGLTAGLGFDLPLPEDVRGVFGTFPVGPFVMIAANNWLVSATAAYGGVAFGLPTAVDMLLNGFIVGALYGVTDPVGFLALVAPHGIIELPAIFVAGGLGFHVAYVTLGTLTGRNTAADLADTLTLTYRVLLGLAIVLIIAAFVEAFVTPLVASIVLG